MPTRTVPINRMTVRSFIAVPGSGARVSAGQAITVKGIAFDGGYGITEVQVSTDGGTTWRRCSSSARTWAATRSASGRPPGHRPSPGSYRLMVRAFNSIGESQSTQPLWNPAGYLRNVIEHVDVQAT